MTDTPHSVESAPPDFVRAQVDNTSRTPIIVYDSIEGKLYRALESEVTNYLRALVPGKSTKVDIYLEVDEKPNEVGETKDSKKKAQAWLARVDLGRLGWTARWQRYNGEIKYVYIKKGQESARNSIV